MNSIPVHKLQDTTTKGFLVAPYTAKEIDYKQSDNLGAHRDDHYIFFIVLEGAGSTVVDFDEKTVCAHQLYYILPEQIHYRIKTSNAKGWFIAADPSLIDVACRDVFESWLGFQQPVALTEDDVHDYDQLLNLVHHKLTKQSNNGTNLNVLHALLRAFIEMAANTMRSTCNLTVKTSRPVELTLNFKRLLNLHIKQCKSPSDYAGMLHVSESYLNEAIKKSTGSSVSFWIRYRVIIEAKRLLYFSNLNVKQISEQLGFENHSYFSRLFSKETGITALAFRKQLRP